MLSSCLDGRHPSGVKKGALLTTRPSVGTPSYLHIVLAFSPIGAGFRNRCRMFPSLVNCVVIDWFQPWPEEALASVSKRFLEQIDLGSDEQKQAVIAFMPYSFLAVEKRWHSCSVWQQHETRSIPKDEGQLKGQLFFLRQWLCWLLHCRWSF